MKLEILKSDEYFRVVLVYGTHHLHSEKLNLPTAVQLYDELKEDIKQ